MSGRSKLLGYGIWPQDTSTRFFPWTRDFIACHGWRSYLVEILWGAMVVYRLQTWRCWLTSRHTFGVHGDGYGDDYLCCEACGKMREL